MLADIFENYRKMCFEIHKLDPAHCLFPPGLAWKGALKNTTVKLDLLTDIDNGRKRWNIFFFISFNHKKDNQSH